MYLAGKDILGALLQPFTSVYLPLFRYICSKLEITTDIWFLDYGNEKEAGEGVARAIKEGLVKREDLFIVSKLWNSFHDGDKVEVRTHLSIPPPPPSPPIY